MDFSLSWWILMQKYSPPSLSASMLLAHPPQDLFPLRTSPTEFTLHEQVPFKSPQNCDSPALYLPNKLEGLFPSRLLNEIPYPSPSFSLSGCVSPQHNDLFPSKYVISFPSGVTLIRGYLVPDPLFSPVDFSYIQWICM